MKQDDLWAVEAMEAFIASTASFTGMVTAQASILNSLFNYEPITIVDCGDFRLCIVPWEQS